jgi:hypothetical protein
MIDERPIASRDHQQTLRKQLCAITAKYYSEVPSGFELLKLNASDIKFDSIQQYVDKMSKPGQWAGSVELFAFIQFSNRNVIVHQLSSDGTYISVGNPFNGVNFKDDNAIHIGHIYNHFVSLRPRSTIFNNAFPNHEISSECDYEEEEIINNENSIVSSQSNLTSQLELSELDDIDDQYEIDFDNVQQSVDEVVDDTDGDDDEFINDDDDNENSDNERNRPIANSRDRSNIIDRRCVIKPRKLLITQKRMTDRVVHSRTRRKIGDKLDFISSVDHEKMAIKSTRASPRDLWRWRKRRLEYDAVPKETYSLPKKTIPRMALTVDQEHDLVDWIWAQRQLDQSVKCSKVRLRAKFLAEEINANSTFLASTRWLGRFLKRHRLSRRRITSNGRKLSKKELDLIQFEYRQHLECVIRGMNVNHAHIYNMDETSVQFDQPERYSIDARGASEVVVKTTGHEKKTVAQ